MNYLLPLLLVAQVDDDMSRITIVHEGKKHEIKFHVRELEPPKFKVLSIRQAVLDKLPKFRQLGFEPTLALLTGSAGRWPHITKTGEVKYGGIPQRRHELKPADPQGRTWLQFHLDSIDRGLTIFGAPEGWDGYVIWDQEYWWPYWYGNKRPEARYRQASIAYVKERNPGISDDAAAVIAEQEWLDASREMMIETILKTRELRPDAKIGIYAYTLRHYFPAGPVYPEDQKLGHDKIAELWKHLDVINPSVYQFYPDRRENRAYVYKNVREAVRVRDRYNPSAEVIPYIWFTYVDMTTYMTKKDMTLTYEECLNAGADGLFMFASWTQYRTQEQKDAINGYIDQPLREIFHARRGFTLP